MRDGRQMDGRECVAGFKGGITEWSNLASATTPGIYTENKCGSEK
jgi:hypothetical protein